MARKKKSSMPKDQMAAMNLSRKVGKRLAKNHPEIEDDCRAGMTHEEIVEKYHIAQNYGLTDEIAIGAVGRALSKLIPRDERIQLRREHVSTSCRRQYNQGIGIHGLTPKERSEAGRKGGSKGGKKQYQEGTGIHAQTTEEKIEIGRIGGKALYEKGRGIFSFTKKDLSEAGKKAALARGQVPWSHEEKLHLMSLCEKPDYVRKSGRFRGTRDYGMIANVLESVFGIRRRGNSLRIMRDKCIKKGMDIPERDTCWGPLAATPARMAEEFLYSCNGELGIYATRRRVA